MRSGFFAILFCVSGMPALAQDTPSFDCAKAESSAEELVCGDPDLAEIDRRLAVVFGEAVAAAEGLDAGAAEAVAVAELKAVQRGWIKGRDDCWKADDLRSCVEHAYLDREAELVALWMLKEPFAVTFWTCGGNPANEVAVMFFDTALPAARVEYGDGVAAMRLARSGSGAKYEGDYGRSFWEHQGEARFLWDQKAPEQSCVRKEG